jgi:ABC-type polysaccharide/polyol phosphate transport system ATPase subunit
MKAPSAIEVSGVAKGFTIRNSERTLSRRLRFQAPPDRRLEVLRDINFEVHKGEFFGVIGRNGSGKSTLLKMIAGIYGVDAGRIRVAGRLAPFLELGVGFSPDLPAYENVVLNGVMMGLTTKEARRRCEEVVEFAGLEDYTDLKLKNYSSGMRVRLGFAVMALVDADVMLVDEVLAVGDAEFREKCADAFERMHADGRTIVLVTHNMDAVNTHCQRALILNDGEIDMLGEPGPVANRYTEVNILATAEGRDNQNPEILRRMHDAIDDPTVQVENVRIEDADGDKTEFVGESEPIVVRATARFGRPITEPQAYLRLVDSRQNLLFEQSSAAIAEQVGQGDSFEIRIRLENRLTAGRYVLGVRLDEPGPDGHHVPASSIRLSRFAVGGETAAAAVHFDCDFDIERSADSTEVGG